MEIENEENGSDDNNKKGKDIIDGSAENDENDNIESIVTLSKTDPGRLKKIVTCQRERPSINQHFKWTRS